MLTSLSKHFNSNKRKREIAFALSQLGTNTKKSKTERAAERRRKNPKSVGRGFFLFSSFSSSSLSYLCRRRLHHQGFGLGVVSTRGQEGVERGLLVVAQRGGEGVAGVGRRSPRRTDKRLDRPPRLARSESTDQGASFGRWRCGERQRTPARGSTRCSRSRRARHEGGPRGGQAWGLRKALMEEGPLEGGAPTGDRLSSRRLLPAAGRPAN